MLFVCLQDEMATGKKRELEAVVSDCLRRHAASSKKQRFKRVISELDRQYRTELQEFLWSMKPQYAITLNLNSPQRPRHDWMKHLDALLHRWLVKLRRANKLPNDMRLSWVAFPEFTTTGNLHFHILLWLPDQHRFSNMSLTKVELHCKVAAIVTTIMKKFFKQASVMVQTIWSKGGVDYATKCVHRLSEIEWAYWRKPRPNHDSHRLNISTETGTNHDHDDSDTFQSGLRDTFTGGTRLSPTTGIAEPHTDVGQRQVVAVDDSPATLVAVEDPRKSHPTRRFDFRGYPYRSLIARIVAMARDWFRMPVTDG